MRPIKFRAWNLDEGYMLDSESLASASIRFLEKREAYSNDLKTYKYEIMQFTGFKDKNGKEIFEGDIVLANGRRQVVEFKFGKWLIVDLLKDDPYTNMLYDFIHDDGKHLIEIIGNRFEHPELLNK